VIARTGILGGSFDPPHVGHTAMAGAARETLGLDRVLLMPAPRPPHKGAGELTAWEHRLAMAELAARDVDCVEVSLHEKDTPGESYTVESLRRFRAKHDDELYFIMGADSLRDLPGWRYWSWPRWWFSHAAISSPSWTSKGTHRSSYSKHP
jgi:nicotinate-nucleotide adenylyltransferase